MAGSSDGNNESSKSNTYNYVPPTIPVQTDFGLRLSALNPKYLHTNSTSHTWPFSAIAELVDNAYDPDVKASQLHIDLIPIDKDEESELCMTFTDNGNGMTSDKLYKMLSFGFCEKVAIKGHKPVGHYGNGFKSGSMRIGKDALVFTKNAENRSLGFLSQTYLSSVKADTIIVPMVTWDNTTQEISRQEEEKCSLPIILRFSVLGTLEDIDEQFSHITSESGTRIIVSKLRRTKDKLEFDILTEKTDIRIPQDIADSAESNYQRQERQQHIPSSDYSLRAYLSILYLKPKMLIYLRKNKVKTVVIQKSLSNTEVDLYKPQNEKPMKIVFGFSENVNHYGIMMYHRNRLIKPYVRVGCQLKANNQGVGVIGVIECGSLQPTHNKQDFDYTPLFRATMNAVGNKLTDYWNEKTKFGEVPITTVVNKTLPDELWAQCDSTKCLKWRRLPQWVKKADLPDKWYCKMHPEEDWANCNVPEEEEDSQLPITPYEKKLKKRSSQLKEVECNKLARKRAAEMQLETLKQQRAEVRNQLQQEEIMRLRKQLAGGQSSQPAQTSPNVNLPSSSSSSHLAHPIPQNRLVGSLPVVPVRHTVPVRSGAPVKISVNALHNGGVRTNNLPNGISVGSGVVHVPTHPRVAARPFVQPQVQCDPRARFPAVRPNLPRPMHPGLNLPKPASMNGPVVSQVYSINPACQPNHPRPMHPGLNFPKPASVNGPVASHVNSKNPTCEPSTSVQHVNSINVEVEVKLEHTAERLHPQSAGTSAGSKKRPISLDSDDEEETEMQSNKTIKTEVDKQPQCIEVDTQPQPQCIDLSDSPPASPIPTPIYNTILPKEEEMESPKEEEIDIDPPGEDTKSNRFIQDIQRLLTSATAEGVDNAGESGDDRETNDGPSLEVHNVSTLTVLLDSRTQALRNIRKKVHNLSKILFPGVDLPDIRGAKIDDTSIEDFLDTVIDAHKNPSLADSDTES